MSRSGHDLWMMEIGEAAGRLEEAEAILAKWEKLHKEDLAAESSGWGGSDGWMFDRYLRERVSELRKEPRE